MASISVSGAALRSTRTLGANVLRSAVCFYALIAASIGNACVYSPEMQPSLDRADRAEQRALVRELAIRADAIFIAKALHTTSLKTDTVAKFDIVVVLKGMKPLAVPATFATPEDFTIGCNAAAGFGNVALTAGRTYIIYVVERRLARAGDLKREWPEISSREEMRLIRKALAPNNALERERGQ